MVTSAVDPTLLPPVSSEPQPDQAVVVDGAPQTAPAPATPQTPAPALSSSPQLDQREQELSTLRAQLAQVEADRQAEATKTRLTEEARQVQRDALARGLTEEDANWMAQRHYALAQSVHQERENLRQQQQLLQGKMNAAAAIGQEYGVSARILMTANSPDEMRAIGEREQRYAAQEARLKVLEQKQVPSQTLNTANASHAGGVVPTGETIDRLWVAYDQDHPGQPNPYDAQYRKLVYG